MPKLKFKLGDSVVVKPNVEDPDLKINLGGWQGRISEINKEDNLICINWDSLTLEQMPAETIDQCEEEGLDWTKMYLGQDEVELTKPRDSEDDVEEIILQLEDEHSWSYLGEEGKRIQAVLADVDEDDDLTAFEAWESHFKKKVKFPFEARVSEPQERGPLRSDDRVTVLGLEGCEDLYGVLVNVQHKGKKFVFPLCDLEALDQSSANYEPVKDYVVWFANH